MDSTKTESEHRVLGKVGFELIEACRHIIIRCPPLRNELTGLRILNQ